MNKSNSKQVELLVYGSANIDLISYAERLPMAGETLEGHTFSTGFGGKGANQCVAAARLGACTALVAKLGNDFWAHKYEEQLLRENVLIKHVKRCPDTVTGIAQIVVGNNGENHIVIIPGANKLLDECDVSEAEQFFEEAKVLLCQLEVPIKGTLAALKSFKGLTILNAAPGMKDMPLELLQIPDIICLNETEAALVTQRSKISNLKEAKEATLQLLEMGANSVILTLGKQGVIYADGKKDKSEQTCLHVPAIEVNHVVDTTGAGDAFLGALAFHLLRYPNAEISEHLNFACKAAAFSVQNCGTQSSFAKYSNIL